MDQPLGHRMQAEIAEQTGIGLRWVESGGFLDESLKTRLAEEPPTALLTFARGTSENAAAYGRYLLAQYAPCGSLKTEIAQATVAHQWPQLPGSLAIGISQSGQSPDLVTVARGYRERGVPVLGIVNDITSPLAGECDYIADIAVGPEKAVAATKSFLAQCLAMLDLVDALGDQDIQRNAICGAIAQMCTPERATQMHKVVGAIQDSFAHGQGLVITTRGPDHYVAREGALKIMETCATPVSVFTTTDLEHGPVAVIGPQTPVLVLVPGGPYRSTVLAAALKLQTRTDRLITVGDGTVPGSFAHIPVQEDDPHALSMSLAIWLQRLTLALSTNMGLDPDAPPGLDKVTRTL